MKKLKSLITIFEKWYVYSNEFFNCIKNKTNSPIPLNEAKEVLKMCLTAHKSLLARM